MGTPYPPPPAAGPPGPYGAPPPGPYGAPPPGPYGAPPPGPIYMTAPPPPAGLSSGMKILMYILCFFLGFPIGTLLALFYVRKKDPAAGRICLILSILELVVVCVCWFVFLGALLGTGLFL